MALQTREQHIRREKATSNICTAQVLLSVMAASYAVYHGPEGLKSIATKIHGLTKAFADAVTAMGFELLTQTYFDTVTVRVGNVGNLRDESLKRGINLRFNANGTVGVSFDEAKSFGDLIALLDLFATATGDGLEMSVPSEVEFAFPEHVARQSAYLTHPVFSSYHTEHDMLRYLKSLESKDLSLVHSMISLGSCTMKLNATAEMIPVTWPEFGKIHPFAPLS